MKTEALTNSSEQRKTGDLIGASYVHVARNKAELKALHDDVSSLGLRNSIVRKLNRRSTLARLALVRI